MNISVIRTPVTARTLVQGVAALSKIPVFKRATLGLLKSLIIGLLVTNASAATYYLDFAGGSDANSGTSTTAPWKRHPFMPGFAGKYVHTAGDQFIFKGGVTWDYTCFPMPISSGGSASKSDYYGVSQAWYAGSSWQKPVFDGGGSPHEIGKFMNMQADYVTIDNIDFTNFYWAKGGWGTSYINVGVQNYVVMQNCLFHGWNHAAGNANDLQIIVGGPSALNAGCVATNCLFDGSASGGNSGVAVYCFPVVRNSIIRNVANGLLISGQPGEVSGCTIGPINLPYDSSYNNDHPNSIEQVGNAGLCYIHHNVIIGAIGVCIMVGNPGGPVYIYDNVILNSSPVPIELDARSGGAMSAYIYNNTIDCSLVGSAISATSPTAWTLLDARNNHFIGGGIVGNYGTVIQTGNLSQTLAQANAAGYTAANRFIPTSASSPTVDKGTSFASIFTTDLLNVTRPQGSAWDIGAYEYASGGGAASIAVTPASQNFGAVAIGTTPNVTFTVQNTGSGTVSGSASVAAPFSVISGSPYSLAPGQSQAVTVRYSPTAQGTNTQNVSFTGANGATCQVTGSAVSPATPVLAVTPSNLNFGSIMTGATADQTITVQNTGSGTLSGSVSASAPFSIISGSPYNLIAGQSQTVTIRYSPTTAGTNTQNLTCTGAGTVTVSMSGSAFVQSTLSFSATAGKVTSPFVVIGNYITQATQTGVTNGGQAIYNFTITNAGNYVLRALVSAPDDSANSLYFNIDGQPQDPTMIWDIPTTSGFEQKIGSWRGNGTYDNNQYVPKVFNLTAGAHQLVIVAREANVELQAMTIIPLPAAPTNVRIISP